MDFTIVDGANCASSSADVLGSRPDSALAIAEVRTKLTVVGQISRAARSSARFESADTAIALLEATIASSARLANIVIGRATSGSAASRRVITSSGTRAASRRSGSRARGGGQRALEFRAETISSVVRVLSVDQLTALVEGIAVGSPRAVAATMGVGQALAATK